MSDTRVSTHTAIRASLWVLVLCLLYAVIRYVIVRHVPMGQVPLYIANKAFAMGAVFIIGISFILGPFAHFWPRTYAHLTPLRKPFGLIGFTVAALHACMSLILLGPAYYGRLYLSNGKLTAVGEVTMLFGILAFLNFAIIAVVGLPGFESKYNAEQWRRILRYGYLAYFFVLLHVGIMGWNGWWRADSWRFGLASISLISSLCIVLVFLIRALTPAAKPQEPTTSVAA